MTVRGGGVPVRCMASNAVPQNGSAASELAADAYPCIMVWVLGPPHTRMWHESSCTCPQLPSTPSSRSQQVCRRARSPQGQACRWPPDGRPSLDRSCARRRQNLAVGARESLRRGRTREIRIGQQRKLCRAKQLRDEKNGKAPSCTPLTKKAQYKQRTCPRTARQMPLCASCRREQMQHAGYTSPGSGLHPSACPSGFSGSGSGGLKDQ